ncbi:MAG: dihydrodipicolinate synthase family protein, partial [Rhodobacteraceae bacterium]|nr:dihydrodipicolinate synthase family protein [Paracoccaceae bacterium]
RAAIPADGLAQAGAIRAAIAAHPLIPAVKHMVARRTGEPDWARALPPFAPLTNASKAALDAIAL